MEHFDIDLQRKWEYENGFYLSCENGRLGKLLNQLEIYKQILNLPGDVVEFGVFKGASLVRLMTFRYLLENDFTRKVIGFDMFGKFPDNVKFEEDKKFVKNFETDGGWGIHEDRLHALLKNKGFQNYELIQGDILATLPAYIEKNPAQKIALLHIDVDVYEPTMAILEQLWDKVVQGGIVMLDDYSARYGETVAVDEFFKDKNITIQKPPFNFIPAYIVKG